MLLASGAQSQSIDKITIEEKGIPGIILMEAAGAKLAREAFSGADKAYTVIVGCGNNGGDGSVCARHLKSMGADVVLCLAGSPEKLNGDAKKAYDMAVSFGVNIVWGIDQNRIEKTEVIIDALLGTGTKGEPYGEIKEAIEIINKTSATVVSVDVPSGINCDTGAVYGTAVKADKTVTFGVAKAGLFLYPARSFAGEVVVVNIGFSPEAVERQNIKVKTIEGYCFPEIKPYHHKGNRGKVLVAAGSEKYSGAAYMSALSALKSGCGISTLLTPNLKYEGVSPELIYDTAHAENGCFSKEAVSKILASAQKSDVVIAGCGIGVTDGTRTVIKTLVENCACPLVIDADGINCLDKETLKNKKAEIIITPHIGEMARFLDLPVNNVNENMIEIAKTVAAEYNIIVVLKSASTVIASPDGRVYVNTYGTGGMATAGSGDVLAGIIGSFVAQGMPCFESGVNGVAVHALSGEYAAKTKGEHFMTATDIIEGLSVLERKVTI